MYSTTMQALNFYYYLLISDEKNKSVSLIRFLNKPWLDGFKQKLMIFMIQIGVKSRDNVALVEKNFLCGIKKALNHYLTVYHEKANELEGHTHSENHTSAADSQPGLPISSLELGDNSGNELSASEELEVRMQIDLLTRA
jgi:hypothetical protein